MNPVEVKTIVWVMTGLVVAAIYRLVCWIRSAPVKPDPWDDSVATQANDEASQPLCWRCLEPVDEKRDFCERCGLPVGLCTNLSPYLYVFSLGDGLRTGTFGRFVKTPLTVMGFVLLSSCEYFVFAPIYWYFLVRNIWRLEHESPHLPPVLE